MKPSLLVAGRLPKVILFDLGGVLVDWDGVDSLVALCGGRLSREASRRCFALQRAVAFEAGMRFALREGGRTIGAGLVTATG